MKVIMHKFESVKSFKVPQEKLQPIMPEEEKPQEIPILKKVKKRNLDFLSKIETSKKPIKMVFKKSFMSKS